MSISPLGIPLDQFVEERKELDRSDMETYVLALDVVRCLPEDTPLVASAKAMLAAEEAFEAAWVALGGER